MAIKNCPKCGSDCVRVDSSRDMGLSEVNCGDCGFMFQKSVPEERIEQLWNKLDRSQMPPPDIDDSSPGPFPSLETHPYEYRLRYQSTDTDMWAPCRSAELERLLGDPYFQLRRRSHDLDTRDLAARQAAFTPPTQATPNAHE